MSVTARRHRYRTRETNIGIDHTQIATAVRTLVDDAREWVATEMFEPDEVAARFHHRLVQIHSFPNGNGRHSRISADYLLRSMDEPAFSWGRNLGIATDGLREGYGRALLRADSGYIDALLLFCRS